MNSGGFLTPRPWTEDLLGERAHEYIVPRAHYERLIGGATIPAAGSLSVTVKVMRQPADCKPGEGRGENSVGVGS